MKFPAGLSGQRHTKRRELSDMVSIRFIVIILFAFLLNASAWASAKTAKEKNILVFFSLVANTPAYRPILDGIRQKLNEEYGNAYNLRVEYLESDEYPSGGYPKNRFDLLNKKYRDLPVDLMICVGTDMISTLKKYGNTHLINLRTISIDFDLSDFGIYSEISLNEQTAVIPVKLDPATTIKEALLLLPKTKSVYFLCGASAYDQVLYKVSKLVADRVLSGRFVRFITDLPMDKVLENVRKLPPNSIIFITSFNADKDLIRYFNPEAVRLISKASNAPVFIYTDMGMGDGAVGGHILSFSKLGLLAGSSAVRLLKGTDPGSIKVSTGELYQYLYDWRVLERWKLTGSERISKHSIIINKDKTFFDNYKWIIIAGLIFLLIQTILIVKLVMLNQQQKITTRQLKDVEFKYREMATEDRILRVGQLTASLSHELNQPLTAILSTAQAGIRFIEANKADPVLLKEILQKIVENNKRTAAILSGIRGMMKLEKREKDCVNLNSLIEEMLVIYHSEAIEHQIQIKVQLTGQPVFIRADRILIQQVMHNFLANATSAMDKTDKKNKLIVVAEKIEKDIVTVSVRDHGIGISATVQENLFKPFVTSRKEGLGIGLAISRTIIDDHHGTIRAMNMPDGGAEFSFSLKIIHDE